MFLTKKKKIQKYLSEKSAGRLSPFDELLSDYLSGKMTAVLSDLDIRKIEIHIDWLSDYRCIGVQGVHNQNYLDLQIEPTAFSIGCDPDEPDDHRDYPLESKEQVYAVVKQTLGL